MRRRLFGTRRRKIAAIITAVALVLSAAAAAQFLIFSGSTGSDSDGTFGSSQLSTAITYSLTGSKLIAGPGESTGSLQVNIVNHDLAQTHRINDIAFAFTSSPPECASHLSRDTTAGTAGVGFVAPAGFSGPVSGATTAIKADATIPATCAGGTYAVTYSGSTTP